MSILCHRIYLFIFIYKYSKILKEGMILKEILYFFRNLIIFTLGSFIFDFIISLIIKKNLGYVLVINGILYLLYGGILLISYFAFDSAHTYKEIHNKESIIKTPKKVNIKDILYSIIAGFILISLEAIFRR